MENNNIKNVSYWIYFASFFLILALPILNSAFWFSPPDWGKTKIFGIIISFILFFFICQIIYKKELRENVVQKIASVSFEIWLLAGLFFIFLLSAIFSKDPLYSFFGDPNRAGGFMAFGFYIIFSILAFFIVPKNDWKKIWDFSIFVGILVSVIAIFQRFKILSQVFIPADRPGSTIGGAIFLGIYLLLLLFLTFSFLLKEKNTKKRVLYLFSILLFIYVILITGSRAAYFGLLSGVLYFLFFYPIKWALPKRRLLFILSKILALAILTIVIYGVFYVNYGNKESKFFDYLENNKTTKEILPRLSIASALLDPRFSVWKVSFEAIKAKPILGYGPENFSIAFDRYYDPSLAYINESWGSWYDRAHNFVFDIAVTAGIPALLIYLALFLVLFRRLQKLKSAETDENKIIYHGIQTTFVAYFAANFFSFDSFSSYLISFLLIAFSLHFLSFNSRPKIFLNINIKDKIKKPALAVLLILLIWFNWQCNIKPLYLNAKMNVASRKNNCQKALPAMEKILSSHSYLDHYFGIKYANTVNVCLNTAPLSDSISMIEKSIQLLEKNTKIRPFYTRNWMHLGMYVNFLLQNSDDPSSIEKLKNKADDYFKKAFELAPKKQEIFVEWIKTYYVIENYKEANELAQQCLDLSNSMGECWWLKGLSNIYLDNIGEAKINFEKASQNGYGIYSNESLSQLIDVYLKTKNYKELVAIHQKLIELEPRNIQYYAALAYNYKVIGEYQKARETAEQILKIDSSKTIKKMVQDFLQTLNH